MATMEEVVKLPEGTKISRELGKVKWEFLSENTIEIRSEKYNFIAKLCKVNERFFVLLLRDSLGRAKTFVTLAECRKFHKHLIEIAHSLSTDMNLLQVKACHIQNQIESINQNIKDNRERYKLELKNLQNYRTNLRKALKEIIDKI